MRNASRIAIMSLFGATVFFDNAFPNAVAAPLQNYCRTIPVRSDASDWPSKHAWDLFISLNHPALPKTVARGVPDCSKPFGTPGTTSVWETWRNAGSEVYKDDGSEPPLWDDNSLPDEKPGRVPALPSPNARVTVRFSPDDGIFHNSGGFGETRLNRATYEFVKNQCLFSMEGQMRYAQAIIAGKKPPIQFPPDSIEAKAAWVDFSDSKGDQSNIPIPADKQATYYTAEFNGKRFGLIALHILTKDLTNWFWASFQHKDTPPDPFLNTPADTYGPPPEVRGTVWENYRLGGTQVDFTLPTGEATLLSDYHVEFDFERTSCMTCHALAAISGQIVIPPGSKRPTASIPRSQAIAICAITPTSPVISATNTDCKALLGDSAFQPKTDELVTERGVPDPKWFQKNGDPYYFQTDFVFSIPFRGKREAGPPPDRCKW
jgi:hypothetical protein